MNYRLRNKQAFLPFQKGEQMQIGRIRADFDRMQSLVCAFHTPNRGQNPVRDNKDFKVFKVLKDLKNLKTLKKILFI
ncbi:MAG: hypothetical protein LBR10_03165 [Prevotellaceae bacterium]|nr:hypothetical protein [Prevotellaceae bacterium]